MLSRARAHPAPLVAVVVNVLIVCTLVAGVGASLPLAQQASLATGLAQLPAQAAVVTVISPYDDEDPGQQDEVVSGALMPVTEIAGGEVVRRLDSGSYDVEVPGRPTVTFAAFSSTAGTDADLLDYEQGQPPRPRETDDAAIEIAVPAGSPLRLDQRIELTNRADDRRVTGVVVGVWTPVTDAERRLGELDSDLVVVAPQDFGALAGAGTSATWRAAPALDAVEPDQLDELSTAVATVTTRGVEAAAAELSASVRADTGLVAAIDERARELVVLRALLLVPAVMLLLLGGGCLFLVAAALAQARRTEEGLLRSRGAGSRQLIAPTAAESALLCAGSAAVAPLLAAAVIRIGDLRPPLTPAAWAASGVAALVCLIALVAPVLLRAVTGDRGEQLSVEKQRRRAWTSLVAGVLVVVALGVLAVAQLWGFGATVADASVGGAGVDPLLVAAPGLLLLTLAVLTALLVLPLLLQLIARLVGARGVSFALGSRFAARAPGRTVPLALVVILASGTVAFAAIQQTSSAAAREARADYEVGADVRVTTPPDAIRGGVTAERAALRKPGGVQAVTAVRRSDLFLEGLAAEALVIDLTDATAGQVLSPGVDWQRLVDRPWRDPEVGVPLPDGTTGLTLEVPDVDLTSVTVALADAEGGVRLLPARGAGGRVELELGTAVDDTRLVTVRTGSTDAALDPPDRTGKVAAVVTAETGTDEATEVTRAGRWWTPGDSELVTFGRRVVPQRPTPVLLTDELARQASVAIGDTLEIRPLGTTLPVEVAATAPYLRTVAGPGGGILLDAGSVLPVLLAAGYTDAPDEWWLTVAEGRADAVATAVAHDPAVAETVTTRADVVRRLDDDPSTGGAALGQLLVLTGGGSLVVGGLLLLSVVLLRRRERAAQDRTLVTVGARRRELLGVLGSEYALTTGAGILAGIALGAVVAQVTLTSMTLGPDGRLLVPAPELAVPWTALLLPLAAMALLPLLAMVVLTRLDHARDLGPRGGGS